jgi:hypothetical protein
MRTIGYYERVLIDRVRVVKADSSISIPATSYPLFFNVYISASPGCAALPVTRIRMND